MMKAYVMTTGTLFGLITVAHVFEIVDRGRVSASDVLIILLSAALVVWAWRVARDGTARL
jgi:hypothetical protein